MFCGPNSSSQIFLYAWRNLHYEPFLISIIYILHNVLKTKWLSLKGDYHIYILYKASFYFAPFFFGFQESNSTVSELRRWKAIHSTESIHSDAIQLPLKEFAINDFDPSFTAELSDLSSRTLRPSIAGIRAAKEKEAVLKVEITISLFFSHCPAHNFPTTASGRHSSTAHNLKTAYKSWY